jgi:hypothetical protein
MGYRVLVVVTLALAGCIEPAFVTCGDLVCPAGSVCLPNGLCATADAVAACAGIADGAPCHTPLFDGSCIAGACTPDRCGDGVVEGIEQCDGPVTGVDCVDYGFDLGIPTCTDHCDIDVVASCVRFGWKRTLAAGADAAWTDGTRFAVVDRAQPHSAKLFASDSPQIAPVIAAGSWAGVTGGAHFVIAWNADSTMTRSDGGPFVDMPPPAASGGTLQRVVVDTDDTIDALWSPGCEVWQLPPAGGWTQLRAPVGTDDCNWLDAHAGIVAVGSEDATHAGTIFEYASGTWTTLDTGTPELQAVHVDGSTVVVATSYDGVYRYTGAAKSQIFPGTSSYIHDIVIAGALLYVSYGGSIDFSDGIVSESFVAPIDGTLIGDGNGNIYMFGAGMYAFAGQQFSERPGIDATIHDIAILGDGRPAMATAELGLIVPNPDGQRWDLLDTPVAPIAVAGRSSDDVWATDGNELDHVVMELPGIAATPSGFVAINDLYAPPSGEPNLYAVGNAALTLVRTGTTWSTIAAPAGGAGCNIGAIDGQNGVVAAVGSCGGTGFAWHLAGASWVEDHRGGPALAAVAVTAEGDVFAVGDTGGIRSTHGVWSDLPLGGVSIAATTSSDVFVTNAGAVEHWDGVAWSRLGVLGASVPRVAARPHEVYLGGTSESVLLRN